MADYQDESENSDDMEGELNMSTDQTNDMWFLDRLHQFSVSADTFSRQLVGRSVVETLRLVHESRSDVERVLDIIVKTARDRDPTVRNEMMEHLPHFLMVCHELELPLLAGIVDRLVPIVVCSVTDTNNQVRKTAHSALLVLMEQNVISAKCIEEQLCPTIVSLTHFLTCADYHPSIITLMSKMAPLLGSNITERLFVPRLTDLCSHHVVGIRKACASNFGDFCAVVTREVTEDKLLPRFCELARDSDWSVRKACAEVIMSVSCACSLQTRKNVLAPVFASLLADVMRWVRMPAFQTLGPFILTFARPNIAQLAYNHQGELILTSLGFEFRFQGRKSPLDTFFEELAIKKEPLMERFAELKPEEKFNNFQYWREPLLEIDELESPKASDSVPAQTNVKTEVSSPEAKCPLTDSPIEPSGSHQDIVPQPLIDHFVSMCDPVNAVSTDTDLPHHCAFSLPAVAYTLGPTHWDLLRDTYTTLASDKKWKVRRTVASSIHELAEIVGEELATQDLVPIFKGFIKDLDEVRIGALRHLACFLKLLRPAGRIQFLPRLADFLKTEYDHNWRFREELACQLQESLCLYSPADTCAHLTPVAISLLLDHVAAVRQRALEMITALVDHVSADISLLRSLLAEIAEQFAHSARWNRRQTFAQLCRHLVRCKVLSDDMFARDVLPHLLDLSWDPVPNVRLTVAQTLSVNIMSNQYFSNEQTPHHDVLIQALKRLQVDRDRDVRYYAAMRSRGGLTE